MAGFITAHTFPLPGEAFRKTILRWSSVIPTPIPEGWIDVIPNDLRNADKWLCPDP